MFNSSKRAIVSRGIGTRQHITADDDAIDADLTDVLEHRLERWQVAVDVVQSRGLA
jgi:hypothetical protein